MGNPVLEDLIKRVERYSKGLEPLRDEFTTAKDERLRALTIHYKLDANKAEDRPRIDNMTVTARKYAEETVPDGAAAYEWASLIGFAVLEALKAINAGSRWTFEREKSTVVSGLRRGPSARTGKTTSTDIASRKFCETIAAELEQVKSVEQQQAPAR